MKPSNNPNHRGQKRTSTEAEERNNKLFSFLCAVPHIHEIHPQAISVLAERFAIDTKELTELIKLYAAL